MALEGEHSILQISNSEEDSQHKATLPDGLEECCQTTSVQDGNQPY